MDTVNKAIREVLPIFGHEASKNNKDLIKNASGFQDGLLSVIPQKALRNIE